MTYKQLRKANVARDFEWNNKGHITLSYRAAELAGECGELCNIIKKIEREGYGMAGSRATMSQLVDELADVVIATDLIAMHMGIDLGKAIAPKFNATSKKYRLATRMIEDK